MGHSTSAKWDLPRRELINTDTAIANRHEGRKIGFTKSRIGFDTKAMSSNTVNAAGESNTFVKALIREYLMVAFVRNATVASLRIPDASFMRNHVEI